MKKILLILICLIFSSNLALADHGTKKEKNYFFLHRSFRKKYMEFGGDGIYAAHQLVYNEPCFRDNKIGFGQAPIAEKLQKELMLFTTNQRDQDERKTQTMALEKTLNHFR